MKGGAAGGGLSQIEPSSKIKLHFNGDFHAIGSAHNLLAALVDAHLFHGNELHLDPNQIAWPRALDMNDRALRHITLSLDSKKEGAGRQGGFLIRSEEHTSELQSRLHLVCRLLLEKKKKTHSPSTHAQTSSTTQRNPRPLRPFTPRQDLSSK